MSKPNFTPGPWAEVPPPTIADCTRFIMSREQIIAEVGHPGYKNYNQDVALANARLMSAAPELYEALSEIVAMLSGSQRTKNAPDAIEAAFAALAKARGEA